MVRERLTFVLSASPGGTLGRYFRGLVDELAGRGHHLVWIVPPGWGEIEAPASVTVVEWPRPGRRQASELPRLVALLRRERPDVAVGSFGGASALLLAATVARVPARALFHHTPLRQLSLDAAEARGWRGRAHLLRVRLLYGRATTLMCATTRVRRDLRTLGVPEAKIVQEPYAIPDPGDGEASRVAGRMVMMGRFAPSKGHDVLVRALPAVVAAVPEAHLHLIGSGELEGAIRRQLADEGVADRVTFLGHVPFERLYAEVGEAAVAVFPSRDEGFGLVTIEAQGRGTPVVGTEIEAFRTTVADGETGLLVPEDDHEALAAALVALLGDEDRRSRMGAAARAWFLDRFALETRVSAIADTYEGLAAPVSRTRRMSPRGGPPPG